MKVYPWLTPQHMVPGLISIACLLDKVSSFTVETFNLLQNEEKNIILQFMNL